MYKLNYMDTKPALSQYEYVANGYASDFINGTVRPCSASENLASAKYTFFEFFSQSAVSSRQVRLLLRLFEPALLSSIYHFLLPSLQIQLEERQVTRFCIPGKHRTRRSS